MHDPVRTVRKDERRYYEDLLKYSRDHLMLYPYHLSDVMVKGLRITPFAYYTSVMTDIMMQEKSYDSLPNFTAADCKRQHGEESSFRNFLNYLNISLFLSLPIFSELSFLVSYCVGLQALADPSL